MTSPVDFRQWINWKAVWNAKTGKNDKIPIDARGKKIDPHDPKNWLTYAEALATGQRIGFTLTDADPFGFIDLDALKDADGKWTEEAVRLYDPFKGAAAEISDSGKGLHVIGRVDPLRVADRRNRVGNVEFYTSKRFIAIAHPPEQWEGSFDRDITDAVLRIVPQRAVETDQPLTSGPRPEYTGGKWSDDELIQRARNSAGSAGASFGNKARFRDLWDGDAAMLCQVFPSSKGDAYDRSGADASLMSHLAFWTGADPERMDRLFRKSALCREKYTNRKDYREATIRNAASQCRQVYDHVSQAIDAPAETMPAMDGTKILLIHQMQQLFDGCVYVLDQHRVMIPGGKMLKPEQFRAKYGGFEFYMQADGARPSRDAFEAFTQNRMHRFPMAETTTFLPKQSPGVIVDGRVNNYFPKPVLTPEGDVTPFLDFLRRFLPVDRDREILLAYLAAMLQHIGEKFPWAVVLQGVEGNGKSMILGLIRYALKGYTHSPSAQDLANPFNSYLENKLAILVDEVHMDGRREMLDTLKPLITGTEIEVQNKGVDKRMIDFCANWLFATNYQDAVIKTRNDRRYAIFFTAQQDVDDIESSGMGGDYFPKLFKWLDNGGRGHVAHYLKTYQIPVELNPAVGAGGMCHRAPETSSTQGAIQATRGKAEQEVLEAIDADLAGFRGGWVSMDIMRDRLTKVRITLSPQRAHQLLLDLGFAKVGRSHLVVPQEDGRPTLYIRKHLMREGIGAVEYMEAQCYTGMMPVKSSGNVIRMPGL